MSGDCIVDTVSRAADQIRITDDELSAIARTAVLAAKRTRRGSLRGRPALIAAVIGALALSSSAFALTRSDLRRLGEFIGIVEPTPSTPAPDYAPAGVPYVSVESLMRYAATSAPVVPRTAIVQRRRADVVFVVATPIDYDTSYVELRVRAKRVTRAASSGNAVVVASGVQPCDRVVVDPPPDLMDGDTIRSYHEQTAEGPTVDMDRLFDGVEPRDKPPIEGGITTERDGRVVLAVDFSGTAPDDAAYTFEFPDGTTRKVPYNYDGEFTEVAVSKSALRLNEPVATVALEQSGRTIARGSLQIYCRS